MNEGYDSGWAEHDNFVYNSDEDGVDVADASRSRAYQHDDGAHDDYSDPPAASEAPFPLPSEARDVVHSALHVDVYTCVRLQSVAATCTSTSAE